MLDWGHTPTMLVAAIACLVGLAAVLVALYRDEPVSVRRVSPDWGPLPSPAEVAAASFPLTLRGYDPATVDAHIDRLRQAYDDLLAVAPPEVIERAHRRASARTVSADDDGEVDWDPATVQEDGPPELWPPDDPDEPADTAEPTSGGRS
jgi:DivIVA domain-containing protein